MSAQTGWWMCVECHELTDEPHSRSVGWDMEETVCPDHCTECLMGDTYAAQDQYAKENKTSTNPGDPIVGHGIPTREQMAEAS